VQGRGLYPHKAAALPAKSCLRGLGVGGFVCYKGSVPRFTIKASSARAKTSEVLDVAARYLAYKLYEVTNGELGSWSALREIGEKPETLARAIERGWVIVRGDGKGKVHSASLTPEGRLLARKGR
jgi:hypothetical protein